MRIDSSILYLVEVSKNVINEYKGNSVTTKFGNYGLKLERKNDFLSMEFCLFYLNNYEKSAEGLFFVDFYENDEVDFYIGLKNLNNFGAELTKKIEKQKGKHYSEYIDQGSPYLDKDSDEKDILFFHLKEEKFNELNKQEDPEKQKEILNQFFKEVISMVEKFN